MRLIGFVAAASLAALALANIDPRFTTVVVDPPSMNVEVDDVRFENNTKGYTKHYLPSGHPDGNQKRNGAQVYGFYECSKRWFEGDCAWTQIQPGAKKCYNHKYSWQGSFGPDKGVHCSVFSRFDCDPGGDRIFDTYTWPGTGDCWDDKILGKSGLNICPGSWRCDVVS